MAKVNLDALIAREDFEVEETISSGKKKETISIEDIRADSFFFANLRKPDFQRETNEWDSQKITDLIKSFVEGDLIPAVILWRSTGGYLFVIDGSHRLSALSAWINDDYGDGQISKNFYDGIVPEEQLEVAQETKELVNKIVGSYSDFRLALSNPEKVKPEIVKHAKNLGALAIQLQWVEGDAGKAESSFFKINQQAAPIDKTELKLLEERKKPYSIASRAIIRSGKGHKYWSSFSAEIQISIQEISAEINRVLFTPKLQTPQKTLDIPIAGKLYSAAALPLILDMVTIVGAESNKDDDATGDVTIRVLKSVRKIVNLLNSNHPSSLGLHPNVYFYSQEGRHKTASFLAMVDFVSSLEARKKINDFIDVRERFEQFIWDYDYLIQQINRKHRIAQKSYKFTSAFFSAIVEGLKNEKSDIDLLSDIQAKSDFGYLTFQTLNQNNDESSTDFSSSKKSAIYIREVMKLAPRCGICKGYIHRNSISIDHIQRKQDGGMANIENGQLAHPYCNTGYKN